MLPINVDWRHGGDGAPSLAQARQLRPRFVRCVSHPDQEEGAEAYGRAGIPTLAIITGESVTNWAQIAQGADPEFYVMRNCTAAQGMNECFEGGDASWPGGSLDVEYAAWWWDYIRRAVWAVHGDWFPLVGPGLSYPRADIWRALRPRLEGVTAGAMHVYPMATGHNLDQIEDLIDQFCGVDLDLPYLVTEFDSVWPQHVHLLSTMLEYCEDAVHFNWRNVPQHAMVGTERLGIFRWVR